jgi:Na+-driven multidrug efflux pump
MTSTIIAVVLHPLWSQLLVPKYGIVGTGYAMVLSQSVLFLSNLLYTYYIRELKDAIFWPDKRATENIGEYLKLGLPSFVMVALDSWAGSFVIFVTGYLSVES